MYIQCVYEANQHLRIFMSVRTHKGANVSVGFILNSYGTTQVPHSLPGLTAGNFGSMF